MTLKQIIAGTLTAIYLTTSSYCFNPEDILKPKKEFQKIINSTENYIKTLILYQAIAKGKGIKDLKIDGVSLKGAYITNKNKKKIFLTKRLMQKHISNLKKK